MSVYLVDKVQLDVIVSYFSSRIGDEGLWTPINGEWQYMNQYNAEPIAYELWRQNVRSVNDRYNEHNDDEQYSFLNIPNARDLYTPAEIAMALDGLEYQSCETDDYYQTEAFAIINRMRKHLLAKMYRDEECNTWSIDELRKSEVVHI